MLKNLYFIEMCFSPYLVWEALTEAAVDMQVLCEESRGGCGSRKRTFKPDTKELEAQGSCHLCRPIISLFCFNQM